MAAVRGALRQRFRLSELLRSVQLFRVGKEGEGDGRENYPAGAGGLP